MNNQETEVVCTWDGTNLSHIITVLMQKNTEIRLRIQGKKLIIKSDDGFFLAVPVGTKVVIPKLQSPLILDDSPEEVSEEVIKDFCKVCNRIGSPV